MTSEKHDVTMLTIIELKFQAVYTNIICFTLQFTFIESIFIDSTQFVNQQMGSFYNSIPDKQLPHKYIYNILLYASIYFCWQTQENVTVL